MYDNERGGYNMARKPKFNPLITKIKLNPEQVVLGCAGYFTGYSWDTGVWPAKTWSYGACMPGKSFTNSGRWSHPGTSS